MGEKYREITKENSSGFAGNNYPQNESGNLPVSEGDFQAIRTTSEENSTWRRVHWLTPLLQVWQALVIILVVALTQSLNNVIALFNYLQGNLTGHPTLLLLLIGVPLVLLALLIVYLYFAWRATSWIITATDVQYRRGIFFKKHRKIPLDRVQSVDVYRPLAARIFGLGALRVESAGGQGSRVEIQFLANKYLDRARREVVARIAGRTLPNDASKQPRAQGVAGTALFAEDDYHLAADEYEVYRVSPGRLLASILLCSEVIWLIIITLAAVIGTVVSLVALQVGLDVLVSGSIISTIISIAILPLMIISIVWSRFNSRFNFSANITHDGIRVTSGLLALKSQTLPPGRIHAIRFLQPLLWRPFGWWQAEVTLAGHGAPASGNQKKQAVDNLLLPVGTLEHAKILDPFARFRRAFAVTDTVLIYRDGWLRRKVSFAPHERAQSVTTSAGPIQRRLEVAGVRLDLVPGTATMKIPHLDTQVAAQLAKDELAASKVRSQVEPNAQWAERMLQTLRPSM